MIPKLRATAAALILAASPAIAADTYVVDKGHSETTFQIRHLMSKVSGRFSDFDGRISVDPARPEASSVEFTIRAASIDTAVPDRDKHLRSADFFDVETYPEIRFKSTRIVPRGGDAYAVTGTLTLRGVSKEITLPVLFLGFAKDPWDNERAGFETSVTLNRKDYGLVWNKALDNGGVLLGDEARITISLETVRQKETASN